MPGASSSAAPPKNKSRLSFYSGAFHYEVSRPLVSHREASSLRRRTLVARYPLDPPHATRVEGGQGRISWGARAR
jgi:hypothetical protein